MSNFLKVIHPTGQVEWINIDHIFSFYPLENPSPTQQTVIKLTNGSKVTISQTVDEILKQVNV